MKRKLILLMFMILLYQLANAQQIFTDDYQKQEVVSSKYKKIPLMSNAKRWVAKTHEGFSSKIDYEDKDSGVIHINSRALISLDKEFGGRLTQFMGFDLILRLPRL